MHEFVEIAGDIASLIALIGSIPGTLIALRQLRSGGRKVDDQGDDTTTK